MPEIVFKVRCQTEMGEDVRVVGSVPALGSWNPALALRMQTDANSYPLWKSGSGLVVDADIEYKYVVARAASEGEVRWEDCSNRRIPVTPTVGHGNDILTVEDCFGDDRLQNICITTAAPAVTPKRNTKCVLPQTQTQPDAPETPRKTLKHLDGQAGDEPLQPLKQIGSSIFFNTLDEDGSNPGSPVATPSTSFSKLTPDSPKTEPKVDSGGAPLLRLKSGSMLTDGGMSLRAGAHYKPKDTSKDGEDAFFIRGPAVGIADGVGDLERFIGHSSRAFAEQLMQGCEGHVTSECDVHDKNDQCSPPSKTAMEIFKKGYATVNCHGATTALVTVLDSNQRRLGIASLGDSGLMILRRRGGSQVESGEPQLNIIFKTPAQQHAFNFPFQLCRAPPQMKAKMKKQPDQPHDAAVFDVDVEEGDLVLVYTDGISDNLTDNEILKHLNGLPENVIRDPNQTARILVSAAYERSCDDEAETPFTMEARLAGWHQCRGGKQDDMTCVAAWVTVDTNFQSGGYPRNDRLVAG